MRIGFFCMSESHLSMAALMLESVRTSMPGVEVHHLTDDKCRSLEGVDDVHRLGGDIPMAVRRMTHNASCEGDWLFVDSDVIFQQDVRNVFDEQFDVALTDRIGTITYEIEYAKAMPYNLGVAFSRSSAFWKRVLYHLRTLSPKYQQWEGDQLVICEMIKQRVSSDFKVKILPGRMYNYPPKFAGDGKHAAIVHYKGHRKQWLLPIQLQSVR